MVGGEIIRHEMVGGEIIRHDFASDSHHRVGG